MNNNNNFPYQKDISTWLLNFMSQIQSHFQKIVYVSESISHCLEKGLIGLIQV